MQTQFIQGVVVTIRLRDYMQGKETINSAILMP